jgi:hypothetical protein
VNEIRCRGRKVWRKEERKVEPKRMGREEGLERFCFRFFSKIVMACHVKRWVVYDSESG